MTVRLVSPIEVGKNDRCRIESDIPGQSAEANETVTDHLAVGRSVVETLMNETRGVRRSWFGTIKARKFEFYSMNLVN